MAEHGAPHEAGFRAGNRRWSFGAAELDERTMELRVSGAPVALERKSLEVLILLLYRAGEVVTKDEMLEAVWPGRILSETVLAKSVSRIREAIGDDESVIKTVYGYGYRLVAPVKVETTRSASAPRLDLEAGAHPPLRPLWSLVERLGGGGHGEVWLARHDKTREQRVFKFALEAAGLHALKREITLHRYLRDTLGEREEFVRALDWNLDEPPYFLEFEHAGGGNLETWGDAQGGMGKVPLPVRLEIVARVADALAAAHSVGVLHKDLKPSNVLIVGGGEGAPRAKLTDFGSGGILDPRKLDAFSITRMGFTRSVVDGTSGGTPLYLAPEIIAGQPMTVQADLYSLGVVLYQMAVGDLRRPLAPGWELQIHDPILCEDIAVAIAGDPANRLADAAALAARLRSLEQRRRERTEEQERRRKLEQEEQAARDLARKAELVVTRARARRNWMATAVVALVVGLVASLALYVDARRARNEATAAAASSRAVADFLSKDLFAVVGTKPLREMSVEELLVSASGSLAKRDQELPEIAAQLHGALGNAFFAVERYDAAQEHLEKALGGYQASEGAGSEAALAAAAQLLGIVQSRVRELPTALPRFEQILARGQERLGPVHPQVTALRDQIAWARFSTGDWRRGAEELQSLITDLQAGGQSGATIAIAQQHLGHMLVHLGDFQGGVDANRSALSNLGSGASPFVALSPHLFLARALLELEAFEEAERELLRAEEVIRAWTLPESSTGMQSIYLFRGLLRLRQELASESIAILERAISVLAGQEWAKDNDVLSEFRSWLALAYSAAGRHSEAQRTMEKALESAELQFGLQHPLSQDIRIGLAQVLIEGGDMAAARDVVKGVDRGALARLGAAHPYLAGLHRVHGRLALGESKAEAAQVDLREAHRIFELRYGTQHAFTTRARAELAQARAAGGG